MYLYFENSQGKRRLLSQPKTEKDCFKQISKFLEEINCFNSTTKTTKSHFFSGRNDVSELMAAADLLLHPAYQEAAGIVLLEAITAGLPVLTTAVCGYAHYIADANCGTVIAEPFSQEQLNEVLRKALTQSPLRMAWAENARHYADTQDLYSLPEKAADIITGGLDG